MRTDGQIWCYSQFCERSARSFFSTDIPPKMFSYFSHQHACYV